jgi:hypothetical protein
MKDAGLTPIIVSNSVSHAYQILDTIDNTLVTENSGRLAEIVELANLSSIIGNLIGSGIANASAGNFVRNGPHRYPDILGQTDNAKDFEIKVALESNKPKGHLAKSGYYLTFRYVLGNDKGDFLKGKENRQNVCWIWEIRFGYVEESDFNLSSTQGDSGKTAVINKTGWLKLELIYENLRFSPRSKSQK